MPMEGDVQSICSEAEGATSELESSARLGKPHVAYPKNNTASPVLTEASRCDFQALNFPERTRLIARVRRKVKGRCRCKSKTMHIYCFPKKWVV